MKTLGILLIGVVLAFAGKAQDLELEPNAQNRILPGLNLGIGISIYR